jgi:hypothetical protein
MLPHLNGDSVVLISHLVCKFSDVLTDQCRPIIDCLGQSAVIGEEVKAQLSSPVRMLRNLFAFILSSKGNNS